MLRGMNTPEMTAALANFERAMMWLFASYVAIMAATAVNFVGAAIAGIHAAKRKETAWTLVIIFFPFVGWIAYWATGTNETPGMQYTKVGPIGPAGQSGRTEADVANEVSAAITEEIKARRAHRNR